MKIWPYVLAAFAIGALAVDGVDAAQARHARHRHAGAAPRAVDRPARNPDVAAKEDAGANRMNGDRHSRGSIAADGTHKDARGPSGHRAGTNGMDVDLIFARPPPPGRGARHSLKPTKPKPAGTASSRHPTDRQRRLGLDAFGRTRTATGGATVPGPRGTDIAHASLGAVGTAKPNPNDTRGSRQGPGFSALGGAVGGRSVRAANAVPHPPPNPAGTQSTGGTGLSGTGAGRPGTGTGAIGGPVKTVAGIAGTGMRSRH